MSFVYEATDVHTGKQLAIKVLSPKLSRDSNSVQRLRREAGLAMRLKHPYVCRILRLGETEEAAHFTLALLDGYNMYTTGNFFPIAGGFNTAGMEPVGG